MPGRFANPSEYRYGFQNQETDPEMLGGAVAFKFRVHDARIGRFLSVDPLASEYPWNSSYAFAENKVIAGKDLEGREFFITTTHLLLRQASPEYKKYTDAMARGAINRVADNLMGICQTISQFTPPVNTDGLLATVDPNKNKEEWDNYLAKLQGIDGATMVRAIIADYKDLYYRAIEGDPEAIGALAVEVGLTVLPGDEVRFAKFGKSLRKAGNILDDVPVIARHADELIFPEFIDDGVRSVDQPFAGNAAKTGLQLESSVAEVMGDSYRAVGEVTVSIKNNELLNTLNETSPGNWVKVYEAGIQNGNRMENHYFRNNNTGQVFDVKTKYNSWHQKAFKTLEE